MSQPESGSRSGSRDAHLPAPGESWTPIRLTRWSGEYLKEKGVENGRLDAELLLARVLNVSRLDLYLQFDRPLRPRELEAFKAFLVRRASREPLQHMLERIPFRELDLRTDARALIPRPETEILVGEVLAWANRQKPGLTGLDVGTGSGAIALSLLKEGSFQRMVGTDPSRDALDLARENALSLGLDEQLELREGSLFEPLRDGERFDVVVSNPPYIPEGERDSLQAEVRDWEPPEALFAGPKGLDVLLPFVRGARAFLKSGGLLATEIGEGQGTAVVRAMEDTGAFREVCVRPDLTGRERVVMGVASG
ncbi:MAG: peptide chain release factor N(5)-glutamine methyltransferase [Gemmatimonadota bacterium]